MRLRQLTCFVRACELGSISKAATELNIAQPALGLQIRSLEDEFAAPLIVRSSRGISPTPAGELVLEWARETLERVRQVQLRLKGLKSQDEQLTVTVGLTISATMLLISPLIETAGALGFKLKIVEGLSQSVAEWVDSGRVDIGIGFGLFETRAVRSTGLMRERLFYISRLGGGNAPIDLADVLGRPLAVPDEQNSMRTAVEAAARTLDMPVFGNYEVGSLQAAREIASRGLAGAIVPYATVADDRATATLSVRRIVNPPIERTLYLMHRADRSPSSSEKMLIDAITRALATIVTEAEYAEAYSLLHDLDGLSE